MTVFVLLYAEEYCRPTVEVFSTRAEAETAMMRILEGLRNATAEIFKREVQ